MERLSRKMSETGENPKEPIDIYEFLALMANETAAIAWQKLGLQPDFVTGKIAPDLDQAKVAVDVVAYLGSLMEGKLDEDDRRQMHSLVRDLRLNYVQKLKEGGES
jgi:hypothetical protein